MLNILDYYYLVLLRGFGEELDHRGVGLMAGTFSVNIFSLLILFAHKRIGSIYVGLSLIFSVILINTILQIIYNKKRRERIKEQYKDEDNDSRERGVIKVVVYEVLSVALLVFAIWWSFS